MSGVESQLPQVRMSTSQKKGNSLQTKCQCQVYALIVQTLRLVSIMLSEEHRVVF
jgi:hypothetical protein